MKPPKPRPPRIKHLDRDLPATLAAEREAEYDLLLYPILIDMPHMNRGDHCEGNTK